MAEVDTGFEQLFEGHSHLVLLACWLVLPPAGSMKPGLATSPFNGMP